MTERRLTESEQRSARMLLSRGVAVIEVARRLGINYHQAYRYGERLRRKSTLRRIAEAQNAGFPRVSDYNNELARSKRYMEFSDYGKALAQIRRNHPKNAALSEFLRMRLDGLESIAWLARELDVSPRAVGHYIRGNCLPNERTQIRLFNFFGIQTSTAAHLEECVWPYILLETNKNTDERELMRARIKLAFEPLGERKYPKPHRMYTCKICKKPRSEVRIVEHFVNHAYHTLLETLSL